MMVVLSFLSLFLLLSGCEPRVIFATDDVSFLKSLEGSVKEGSMHVTYDDYDGKKKKYDECIGTPTIGYGTTDRREVMKGEITEERAQELLKAELESISKFICDNVTVELTVPQMISLESFVYNVGRKNFLESTLLKVLNDGKYDEVPAQMMRWVYSGGKVSEGLKKRRKKEVWMWNMRPTQSHVVKRFTAE